ncbi:NAD-dependent epimerase [Accumulibacter sp.]|uniref:NAD-dependent epimerase n=1 Tax=Accumulibacter sp. TaxID=2053492 RepID=UPI0026270216|nr:NAD-dependent epimerase [Accumulibacter sp.]
MKLLVTGVAGFIGMHVAQRFLRRGDSVVGIDNLNDYYDVHLKRSRLACLTGQGDFRFIALDVADRPAMAGLFASEGFERVTHLAAQAGVRYSLLNPHAYVHSNLLGFVNVLEGCRQQRVQHLVYASSSSVYGGNTRLPFAERDNVDHPVSLYAATKKANELLAHTYSHLYRLPTTGLRFFTVYGPWGRPDMAPFLFTRAILEGRPIDVFNHGRMRRDFTYVDDVVEAVLRVHDRVAEPDPGYSASAPDPATSDAPYRVFNVGNRQPVALMDFIGCLEQCLGRVAEKRLLAAQPGDVPATCADTSALDRWIGFAPDTPLADGIGRFVDWYRRYYKIRMEASCG